MSYKIDIYHYHKKTDAKLAEIVAKNIGINEKEIENRKEMEEEKKKMEKIELAKECEKREKTRIENMSDKTITDIRKELTNKEKSMIKKSIDFVINGPKENYFLRLGAVQTRLCEEAHGMGCPNFEYLENFVLMGIRKRNAKKGEIDKIKKDLPKVIPKKPKPKVIPKKTKILPKKPKTVSKK